MIRILYSNKKSNINSLIYTWVQKMSSSVDKPIENKIKTTLQSALKPTYLEILNESYMHNVPKTAETHFKIIVVSKQFENQPLIKRHRMINELLADELQTNIHALSIIAKTPSQWNELSKKIDPSPACRGGFGK
ncbi:bolA-like protein DDB_G0274169 [Chelonus insularis]|uniref:bolA-like protein DDB_G0274169 n=1 Tax=Chelonus insularis TaxID=460826 RepID=UPI00158E26C0|nr:bolA-like protein DDB_G0274169 [Chelonus insularis]